jgi:hypothetical protein
MACLSTVGEAPHSTKDIRAASSLSGEWPLDFKERPQDRNAANTTLTPQSFSTGNTCPRFFSSIAGRPMVDITEPASWYRSVSDVPRPSPASGRGSPHPPLDAGQPPHVMDQPDPFRTRLAEEERGARAEARAGEQLRRRDISTNAKYTPSRSTESSQCGVQSRPDSAICIP